MWVVALVVLAGCTTLPPVDDGLRSRTPTPFLVATRVPAPIPLPTRLPWQAPQSRSLTAPAAPVAESGESEVINQRLFALSGGETMFTADFVLMWSHEDPVSVDYYEVWRDTNAAYWTPETCDDCALVATSSGMSEIFYASPAPFDPISSGIGAMAANIMSSIDFYLVRAVNDGGTSDASNMVGVVHYSLKQGIQELPYDD